MSIQPPLAIGQTWRRKRDRAQVKIGALRKYGDSFDIYWESVERPRKRGAIWEHNFRKAYDLVPIPD